MNPAAMTERLIDSAIYNEQASGAYVAGALKELNEARAAIEDAISAKDRELAEAREARQRSIDYSIDLQRIIEDLCGGRNIREPGTTAHYHYDMAVAATRARDEALSALREKEEAHLSGLACDIAREIEAHDLFDCPEGTTYVRAAQAIADRLVERFGCVRPVSREQRGEEA